MSVRAVRPGSKARGKVSNQPTPDAVILSWSELQAIQNSARLNATTQAQLASTRRDQSKSDRSERAQRRKEKMLKMERERKAQRANVGKPSHEREHEHAVYANARKAMDEELDDVKHMNQMMLYAKCATIRDAQVAEKARIKKETEEEERRLDAMMELERLRTIKLEEETQRAKRLERRQGASVIVQQIEQREAERIRQQELREQEAKAMVESIRQQELREEEERRQKVIANRELLESVMKANTAQAAAKLAKKQEAVEEDLRIAEYLRQKELKEQEEELERDRLKAIKDREIGRLRHLQEKAQDRRSEIDELRAKRYQEEKDRIWRKSQLDAAAKKQQMIYEMRAAREAQRLEKAQIMAEQAMQEREEYFKNLEWQKTQHEMEQRKLSKGDGKQEAFRQDLLDQIDLHEKEREKAREKFLAEGQGHSTVSIDEERYRLEKIKAQKIKELQDAGVPEKYLTELKRKKVLSNKYGF